MKPRKRRSPEGDFQAHLIELAKLHGWRHYHTHNSRHSPAGFPDLVLVRPPRLIFAELKAGRRKPTDAQREWLSDLERIPKIETYVWYPEDLNAIAKHILPRRALR